MSERSQKDVWRLTPWLMIGLLLANFFLMAFDAREINTGQRVIRVWAQSVAYFVQSPVTSIGSGVTGVFQSVSSLRSAQDENSLLKQKVQELEVQIKQKEELTAENERLKGLLQLKEETDFKVLAARIIGRDTSAWFDSSIINRGSLDGVKLNMAIVTDGGLVGRVTAVSPLTAQVDLITKDKSGLGGVVGEIGSSNALGVISGTGKKETLEMRYVPGTVEVNVGDKVYTTGQDGIFPAGLKIGEISEVRASSASVTQQIFVHPTARLNSMQEVGVLLYEPPPRLKFEEQLPNAVKEKK